MPEPHSRKALYTYLILLLAFSSIFYTLIIRSGHLEAGHGWFVFGLMYCPAASALITCVVNKRRLSTLGWRLGKPRYLLASYFIPLGYASVVYGAAWALRLGGFNPAFQQDAVKMFHARFSPDAAMAASIALMATVGVLFSCVSALGEEIGWRGFLVPELASMTSFTRTALISGAIWASWHMPILLFADYNAGTTPKWYAMICFATMVMGASFLFAWMRLKSGSLWTGVLLHASHNLFIQAIFDRAMRDTGKTLYFTTEFGAGLALALAGVAFYCWKRRGEVELRIVKSDALAAAT